VNFELHAFLATKYCMSLKYLGKSTTAVWCHNIKGDFILRRFSGLNISASKMPDSPAKKAKVEEEPHPADLVQADRLQAYPEGVLSDKFKFNKKRVRTLSGNDGFLAREAKGIVYYMHRDQRVQDNWALIYAQRLAYQHNLPLSVVAMISAQHPKDTGVTLRNLHFCLHGLKEVQSELSSLKIGFQLVRGWERGGDDRAGAVLGQFIQEKHPQACVVTDFSPLRIHRGIVEDLIQTLPSGTTICQVDSHNVVPVWETSDKQEYAARTIRNKVTSKLDKFLTDFPPVVKHDIKPTSASDELDPQALLDSMKLDKSVPPSEWARPGTKAGFKILKGFCSKRLARYSSKRNDPNENACSNMSPWFHLGQISVQRAVLHVKKHGKGSSEDKNGFIEEAVVRSELSDNFCFYNPNYDSIEGGSDWARKTLQDHAKDKREYVYTEKELESGRTHDELWNSAQLQLVKDGKIHGFMRMYWAKKILEWTESPEEALRISIRLNDHYSLDGCDSNGYVGCMWSIVGIHDMGWTERPIFGKIRYMNYAGCKRKFDIAKYTAKHGGKSYKYDPKKSK